MRTNRSVVPAICCLVTALLASPIPAQEPGLSDVEIETVPVAEGVYMLVGSGGNIGVSVGEDGVFLIDDQFAPLTEKILAALAELSDQPPQFVLNTHWHHDHTGGNENLGRAGVFIVAHDRVRERMSVDQVMETWGRTVPAAPPQALPDITFGDAVTFHLNGDTLHAFYAPAAHTDDDVMVWFESANAAHMGDAFFNGTYPFIDVESGGTIDGVIQAAERMLELADDATRIIPGHGPLGSRTDLESYLTMLTTVRQRVASALEAGQTGPEIIAAKLTSDLDAEWGGDAERGQRLVGVVVQTIGAVVPKDEASVAASE